MVAVDSALVLEPVVAPRIPGAAVVAHVQSAPQAARCSALLLVVPVAALNTVPAVFRAAGALPGHITVFALTARGVVVQLMRRAGVLTLVVDLVARDLVVHVAVLALAGGRVVRELLRRAEGRA